MKVFVAGATGAIGRPLVSALKAAGHEVIGMTSTEGGLHILRERGVDGVVANALDGEAVKAAIARIRPAAVIEELTSLPKRYTPEEMQAAARLDRKLRLEGGLNVQNAAGAVGVKRYVVQSTGFFYGPGTGLATEDQPLAFNASPGIAASVRTYTQIEKRVLCAPEIRGVSLRYGFFYGPGTYHDPENGSVSQQVRVRAYPVIGSGRGTFSFVHVEDAAAATVAALEAKPGVYNIVDDDPSEMARWLPAFAQFLGAPSPGQISEEEAVRSLGPDSVYSATQLRGAANGKAKSQLNFAPRRLEWLRPDESPRRAAL